MTKYKPVCVADVSDSPELQGIDVRADPTMQCAMQVRQAADGHFCSYTTANEIVLRQLKGDRIVNEGDDSRGKIRPVCRRA